MPYNRIMLDALVSLILIGKMTHYAPNLMNRVYENQLYYKHITPCTECVGRIAAIDCKNLNKIAYLFIDGKIIGPLHAVDCANAKDVDRLQKRGLIGELSYELAKELGTIGVPLEGVSLIIVDKDDNLSKRHREIE